MSKICLICSKKPRVACNVSNANNKTKRWVYPNVHVMRFTEKGNKSVKRGSVCTKCLKSGKVEKIV